MNTDTLTTFVWMLSAGTGSSRIHLADPNPDTHSTRGWLTTAICGQKVLVGRFWRQDRLGDWAPWTCSRCERKLAKAVQA